MGIRLNPGQDGELLASTEKAVVGHYQQIALAYLDSGTPIDVTPTNKLPVVMDLSTLATAALQGTSNTKLDSIITALALLATEATAQTLGTESTLATRLSESTGQQIRDELDLVHHDPGVYPTTIPETPNRPGNYIRIGYGDSPAMDAFGRLRASQPHTRFDSSQVYQKDRQFDEVLTAGGTSTFNPNRSAVQMATTAPGDAVSRQTYEYVPYEPGKSQLAFLTFVDYQSTADVTSRIGLFDANNGVFLQLDDQVRFGKRTETSGSPVDTTVVQASWNLDPLDGTGPSGITLDRSKIQIAVFDFEWLGAGRIRAGFVIDGLIIYCHQFLHSNIDDKVWGLTGHLPVRFEITQSGATAGQLDHICSTVISEGGSLVGEPRSYSEVTPLAVTNAQWFPLISLRPKLLYQTLQNRKSLIVNRISVVGTTTNDLIMVQLVWGCTLTAPTWAVNPGNDYAGEIDTAATASTGGIVVAAGQAGDRVAVDLSIEDILSKLKVALDTGGAHPTTPFTDILSLQVRSIPASANVVGSMDWVERGP
jgi:hypothetical protein